MKLNDIIITEDGSHSVYSVKFNATYHSQKGAVQESRVVFINTGLAALKNLGKNFIRIFEMGFGTGLNVHLSYIYAEQNRISIDYTTIEAYPLDKEVWSKLNYGQSLGQPKLFYSWHDLPWDNKVIVSDNFSFNKIHQKLEEFTSVEKYDLIYFDAFGPGTQPNLWVDEIMAKMHQYLNTDGILVTYCASGEFKRSLKRNHFSIESLPGPPGKREIIRATALKI
ncbi:MAG: tRNA (5-methylaminomethyl-2-thiouridine)(34)-methyltransferase MnmD [Saprospiraceae bacterium]